MDCDLLIIGSGFGGSPLALRAAQAGMRVIVLERGRRVTAEHYEQMARGAVPLLDLHRGFRPRPPRDSGRGVFEVQFMRGLIGVVGSAVGGGSHHYTSVTVPAPADVFADGWPADWTFASMQSYYERIEQRLRPSPVPWSPAQTVALESFGQRLGVLVRRLPLAIEWPLTEGGQSDRGHPGRSAVAQSGDAGYRDDTCGSCGQDARGPSGQDGRGPGGQDAHGPGGWRRGLAEWLQGNGVGRKNTLDEAYLRDAEALGAKVLPLHQATLIAPIRDGYVVEYVAAGGGAVRHGTLRAPRVALSAGTFGTLRLLLDARDRHHTLPRLSRTLGCRFSTNGDSGALLLGPHIADDSRPAPIATAWLDYWHSDGLYLMELGWLPLLRRRLARWLAPLLRVRDGGRHDAAPAIWIIGAMGRDQSPGRIVLGRDGRMGYVAERGDGGLSARSRARLAVLARASGATVLRLPSLGGNGPRFTFHPLGGCALADSPDVGVCDSTGHVFGYPGLYVADGSLLPTATGAPPSMTIAALAERVAEGIIRS